MDGVVVECYKGGHGGIETKQARSRYKVLTGLSIQRAEGPVLRVVEGAQEQGRVGESQYTQGKTARLRNDGK